MARLKEPFKAGDAMTLVIWIYEQLYINLGSVVCVAFFLMMAAPAYITTQGVAVRR